MCAKLLSDTVFIVTEHFVDAISFFEYPFFHSGRGIERYCCTVQGNKPVIFSERKLMNGSCDQFLPASTLPKNQNREIHLSNLNDLLIYFKHTYRIPDERTLSIWPPKESMSSSSVRRPLATTALPK